MSKILKEKLDDYDHVLATRQLLVRERQPLSDPWSERCVGFSIVVLEQLEEKLLREIASLEEKEEEGSSVLGHV